MLTKDLETNSGLRLIRAMSEEFHKKKAKKKTRLKLSFNFMHSTKNYNSQYQEKIQFLSDIAVSLISNFHKNLISKC